MITKILQRKRSIQFT